MGSSRSRFGGAIGRVVGEIDNHVPFPAICATSGKWFHRRPEVFRGRQATKQNVKNINYFSC
jgi:hypothetical protein